MVFPAVNNIFRSGCHPESSSCHLNEDQRLTASWAMRHQMMALYQTVFLRPLSLGVFLLNQCGFGCSFKWPIFGKCNNNFDNYAILYAHAKKNGSFSLLQGLLEVVETCQITDRVYLFRALERVTWYFKLLKRKKELVGGWTNPFEKYARQIGNLPQGSGWK